MGRGSAVLDVRWPKSWPGAPASTSVTASDEETGAASGGGEDPGGDIGGVGFGDAKGL